MKVNIENKARLAFAVALLLGAAVVSAWYFVSSARYASYQIRTRDVVSGLIVDAPVEFHGVEVGKVTQVDLIGPDSVSIMLSVKKDAPVSAATVATITARGLATRGFTGYVYVALENTGSDLRPLVAMPGNAAPLIRWVPSRSVTLDTTISQVNENVQAMTDLLRSVLDSKTIDALKQSVDSLQQVTSTLAANNARLNTILVNAERASSRLKPLLESSDDTVRELQNQVLPKAYSTLGDLDNLAKSLKPLLESGDDTVRVLQDQVLPQAYSTLADMDRLTKSLNGVATKVNRDPSILIRGTALKPGPGEQK